MIELYMEWDFPGIAGLDKHWRYGWYVPQSSPWSFMTTG